LLNDEGQSSESDFETDSNAVTATFRTESRITPRDYAIARPILNFISCICTDMKGPFKIPGLQGEIYYQSFIEKETKIVYQYFFKKKSEAVNNLRHLLQIVFKSEGVLLHAYQSDGAKELISKDIVKLLADNNSKIIYAPPYSPRLNSLVERNHRTIFEAGFAMLLDSGRPTIFWVQAIQYAGLIFMHFPTSTEYGYMSPIEAKYGLIPDVSRLKRWGCWCFVHIHKETRAKGFVEKAYKAFFLGFDVKTQSYICYLLALDKIQLSAHVIFDELSEVGKTTQNSMLEFTESANVEDFKYLENMLYMDGHII
jgi:hypothetical protein